MSSAAATHPSDRVGGALRRGAKFERPVARGRSIRLDELVDLFQGVALEIETAAAIESAAARVARLAHAANSRHTATVGLSFAAEALAALVLDPGWQSECADALVDGVAGTLGLPREDVVLSLFRQAGRDPHLLELPPRLAIEAQLRLISALVPLTEASLWVGGTSSRVACLVSVGDTKPTRRARAVAQATLENVELTGLDRGTIYGVPVSHWQRTAAALVVRTRPEHRATAVAFLEEAARMLAPALQRDILLERNARRERLLVEASEKRLVRLGFDIHDGPLQDLALLTADVRNARGQIGSLQGAGDLRRVAGRLDDFEAQVTQAEESLRELALSLGTRSIVQRPIREALEGEIASFEARTEIATEVSFSGDLDRFTTSQRIALFRILQEALTNIREHSGASSVRITLAARRDCTVLTVVDDGDGFDVTRILIESARRGRLGLVGISERARLLGGTFDVRSRIGGPTEFVLALPAWAPCRAEAPAEHADAL